MPTVERLKELLKYDPESGEFIRLKTVGYNHKADEGSVAGSIRIRHICIKIDARPLLAHRLAYLYMTGVSPEGEIDHINMNGLDNRWSNLRLATPSQNKCNVRARIDNKLGLKGVHRAKEGGKYKVQIGIKGKKRMYLGRFSTPEEARTAYLWASRKLHGKFSRA
jgi:hypothetical protein